MSNYRFVVLSAFALCLLGSNFDSADEGAKSTRYASDRFANRFVGATRVVLDEFDPTSKDLKSATLQLDKNEVSFSIFGDPRVSVVFYMPLRVKLTRLSIVDPTGKDRRIFSVALPDEQADLIGKSSIRLVIDGKSDPISVRLLLVSSDDKVTQTLELRPASK